MTKRTRRTHSPGFKANAPGARLGRSQDASAANSRCHDCGSSATIAEIVFGIEQVADPMFRAELESWLRDEFRAWFGARILEVDAPVLLT